VIGWREVIPRHGAHLTHMPNPTSTSNAATYRDAMHWNQKAIIADRKLFYDRAGPMNFYSGYRVHNYHFAAYGAMVSSASTRPRHWPPPTS